MCVRLVCQATGGLAGTELVVVDSGGRREPKPADAVGSRGCRKRPTRTPVTRALRLCSESFGGAGHLYRQSSRDVRPASTPPNVLDPLVHFEVSIGRPPL